MGNGVSHCFIKGGEVPVKLVFWGGSTAFLGESQLAGELLFRFPESVVCHADSFYIGRPIPMLAIEDQLKPGETYFVLPVDRFPWRYTLTAASLASLSAPGVKMMSLAKTGHTPFEYVKDSDGRTLIKVSPEFITRAISNTSTNGEEEESCLANGGGGSLCSTPELQKHYAQLVGSRSRNNWSPKLETITERKNRLSPSRLLGLEYWR